METWERRGAGDSPGWPGQRANYGAGGGCVQSAVASGLGGEEQAGELTAAAVSVHKGQGVLCVVPDHGGHGGEQLDRKQGIGESPEPHAGRNFLKELWDSEEEARSHFSKPFPSPVCPMKVHCRFVPHSRPRAAFLDCTRGRAVSQARWKQPWGPPLPGSSSLGTSASAGHKVEPLAWIRVWTTWALLSSYLGSWQAQIPTPQPHPCLGPWAD